MIAARAACRDPYHAAMRATPGSVRGAGERLAPATDRAPILGFAAVLTAAALFGTLGPTSRIAYRAGLEPLSFVTWRAAIAALAVLALVAWGTTRGRAIVRPRNIDRWARLGLVVAAITATTLNLGMFASFNRIPIGLALLAFYTYPAMTAVVAVVLRREPLDRSRVIALVLATAGMALVLAGQLDGSRLDVLGILLALSAAVSQTVFVTISRDAYRSVPADQAMAFILATSAATAAFVAVLAGIRSELVLPLVRPDVLPILVFTGIAAAAVPSLLFLNGIRVIGGTRAAILMLLEPLVGVLLAAWFLAEGLQPIQLLGGAAILAAAVVLQRAAIATSRPRPEAMPREAA
jgi:drug/metabolite transporter (DMT)-like permease